ncbi:MAG: PadR family transcriptional regulator [Desulfovermiculus sp.]|nr:PadR family transcriptional regulator [Desulfovermiculus sp.]
MDSTDKKAMQREILLGFWKVHILHHAAQGPVVGQWMIRELRRHGYEVSPGTMYPLLSRLEQLGWLQQRTDFALGQGSRKEYELTAKGREALAFLKDQVTELYREVVLGQD